MGKCSIGSACRDRLKAWASAVFLFTVMMFVLATKSNYKVHINNNILLFGLFSDE